MIVGRVARKGVTALRLPAFLGGMNTVDDGDSMPPIDASDLYNIVSGESGPRVRRGTSEWAIGFGKPVTTLITYTGASGVGTGDRIFAVTRDGIFDGTTLGTSAPVQMVGGASGVAWEASGSAGFGTYASMVNPVGTIYGFYADERNGLYRYDPTAGGGAGAWEKMTTAEITSGIDPVNAAFVAVWKHRLWLVEKDTLNAYYLGLDSVQGGSTKFSFSGKAINGGHLVGLWSWSYDGGAGADDLLVAVTAGGDVLVYQGTDPSLFGAFGMKGVWTIGGVPSSRNIGTSFGGDLALVSTLGMTHLGTLVAGGQPKYTTRKISNTFNERAMLARGFAGWGVALHPQENALLVAIPADGNALPYSVYAMSMTTGAWSRYTGVNYCSGASLRGRFFIGTTDGKILLNDGYSDNVQFDGSGGEAIEFGGLSAFKTLGRPSMKQIMLIRPSISSTGPVDFTAEARYDYDLTLPTTEELGSFAPGGWATDAGTTPVWQADTDDTPSGGIWSDDSPPKRLEGVVFLGSGIGVAVAVAFKGSTSSRTVLTGFDLTIEEGGFL